MPFYDTKKKILNTGEFSNCNEMTVYHFLNCIFWNQLKKWYEVPDQNKSSIEKEEGVQYKPEVINLFLT